MVGGGRPLLLEIFLGKTDPIDAKTVTINRYYLVAAQPLELAKKVQLSLIGSRLRTFQ